MSQPPGQRKETPLEGPWDLAVCGAGACGLMAALTAAKRGLSVILFEKNAEPGKKILISGGGRCNFTNRLAGPRHYQGESRHFHQSALRAFPPAAAEKFFSELGIQGVEKAPEKGLGQLFPHDNSARNLRDALVGAATKAGVTMAFACGVAQIEKNLGGWVLGTNRGVVTAKQVALCTGGMAYPQLGADDFALRVARSLGLETTETAPALVPLVLESKWTPVLKTLSGLALPVKAWAGRHEFRDDMLFAHFGLSGPAILQVSSFWRVKMEIGLDFLPDLSLEETEEIWKSARNNHPKRTVSGVISSILPSRFLVFIEACLGSRSFVLELTMASLPKEGARDLTLILKRTMLKPAGTMGYVKAEVMRGGIATRELNPSALESRKHPGLFIGGEAVDVTGWLGGYNFQWAWASGRAIGLSAK